MEVPKEVIKAINKIIYNFLWNKIDRIKRKTLINDFSKGGIRMVDVESMISGLKAAWIPRLLKCKRSRCMFDVYLKKVNLNVKVLLDGGICDRKDFPKELSMLPVFYSDCIA